MTEINKVGILTKEKQGSWLFSKQLLENCESEYNFKDEEKLSKNNLNIYKVMQWLESNNKIENHRIEKNIWILVPQKYNDFLEIIGKNYFLKSDKKCNNEDFEINYKDTTVFQHNRQPRLDRGVSESLVLDYLSKDLFYEEKKIKWALSAEDFKSGDMCVEEMVKRNPCLEDRFREVLHFKNAIKAEAKNDSKKKHQTSRTYRLFIKNNC